jgi:hypothetical protein
MKWNQRFASSENSNLFVVSDCTQIWVFRDITWSLGLLGPKSSHQVLYKIITFIEYTSSPENRTAVMMMMTDNLCHHHHCIPSCKATVLGIEIVWHKRVCDIIAPLKRSFTFIGFRRRSYKYSCQIAMSLSSYLLKKALVKRFIYIKTTNK